MKMMSWSRYHCLSPSLLRRPRKFSRRDLKMLGIRRCRGGLDSPRPEGEVDAKRRVRGCAPSMDRTPSPQPSPIEVGYIRLRQFETSNSGKPELDGRGGAPGSLRGLRQASSRYFQFVIRLFRT
jgi:hypothetical protein